MTTAVVTVTRKAEIPEVARLLEVHRISAVPVVDDNGNLCGIVSEGDLMRRAECNQDRSWWLSLLADKTKEFSRSFGTRVEDVMTRDVISIDPETQLSEIARILETKQIKRVPVVQDRRLVGIVSRADVLRGLAVVGAAQESTRASGDLEMRNRITETVRRHTSASLSSVSVIVANGAVYLWGVADTRADKEAIRIAAENIAGVGKVHDFLSALPEVIRAAR